MQPINLAATLDTFTAHWSPRIVGHFNGHDLMVVKVLGEFVWHDHPETDDFFMVLSGALTIDLVRKLIELTHAYTAFGFAVTVRRADYERLVGPRTGMPESAYAFALFAAMTRVRAWTEKANFNGRISYVFETGHGDRGKASAFMDWMFASARVAANQSYGGHAFLPKVTPGLHPADMLAWHWNAEVTRRHDPNRRPVRADFKALLRDQDFVIEYDLPALQALATSLQISEERRAEIIREVETGKRDISDLPRLD